jgi:multidrug resistance efflux pump
LGDHVKEGQLLAPITAWELDHQIAQAEATLGQATLRQNQANEDLGTGQHQRNVSRKEGCKLVSACAALNQANELMTLLLLQFCAHGGGRKFEMSRSIRRRLAQSQSGIYSALKDLLRAGWVGLGAREL